MNLLRRAIRNITFTLGVLTLCACGGGGGGGVASFTVNTSAGANGSISPASATVTSGASTSFTVTPDADFVIDSVSGCSGSLAGNTYTTGAITAACTVTASFIPDPATVFAVSTNAGANGSISPSFTAVIRGSTTTFTITPDSFFNIADVSGCGGSRSGNIYTTGPITADCTVTASFTSNPVTVFTVSTSAGANGSISPASATVNSGASTSFTVTPDAGFDIDSISGCSGSLAGNTYSTGAITADCTVTASFTPVVTTVFTVSTSAGANGSISPGSATVDSGASTSFTVTPDADFIIDSVSGCSGSLVGNTYTTGAITAACTVTASFIPDPSTVFVVSTSAGANGSISPTSANVTRDNTASFTVTPDADFIIDSVSGCSGSLVGNTYTTGAITADCTVTASFIPDPTTVFTVSTSAGTNGSISPTSANVTRDNTTSFTVTPDADFVIDSVSGCAGALAGNTYTTGPITTACTVTASFIPDPTTVFVVSTSAGANGSISPTSANVTRDNTTSFTVTPDTDFVIDSVSGCSGSLTGNTYTTGAVTVACTVTASFVTIFSTLELVDPTPGANDRFGDRVIMLANGNIVVTDPGDSSVALNNGAVHLFNKSGETLIASIYGDNAGDQFGAEIDSGGFANFVNGVVTALGNSNFVITAPLDDVSGVTDAGSVRLINGSTGAQISATRGAEDNFLGSGRVAVLANSNYAVASPTVNLDTINVRRGTVQLFNGATGAQIGPTHGGVEWFDEFGSDGVFALGNNNFVIASSYQSPNGTVRLVSGTTGLQIGPTAAGDSASDRFGSGGIIVLANNNYVIASPTDDVNGLNNAGSVQLVNGANGQQIGAAFVGDQFDDVIGEEGGIIALTNDNYVIASPFDDVNGVSNAGSVRLVNGTNGQQIGSTLVGSTTGGLVQFGVSKVAALSNDNFVFASDSAVRLVNGASGVQVGVSLASGSGSFGSGVFALPDSSNFVVAATDESVNSIAQSGSVRLVDGTTNDPIGPRLAGETANDRLGYSDSSAFAFNYGGGATALANNNFVVISAIDDVNTLVDVGSARLVDGITGLQIGTEITGSTALDLDVATVTGSATGVFYILAAPMWDNNAGVDSGLVRLVVP